jgi:tRNA-binding protein
MPPATIKPVITLDVLNQVDIRVGTILSVSDVPNSDNLMQLRVDFGDHERTIVAGIKKERANPREIEGKQALFVVNLKPRKMRGAL